MRSDCLGSADYAVDIIARPTRRHPGGRFRQGPDLVIESGTWSRKLSALSSASVVLLATPECCEDMQAIDPKTVLLEVERVGTGTVWLGPVKDLVEMRDGTIQVTAEDFSMVLSSERETPNGNWPDTDLVTIFRQIVEKALVADNPGITIESKPAGIADTRVVDYSDIKLLGPFLDDLTESGVEWTMLGGTLYLGGEPWWAPPIATILSDADFVTLPRVRRIRSGTEFYVRGNGVYGRYGEGWRDDGIVIHRVRDQNDISTQSGVNAASRRWWGEERHKVSIIEANSAALSPSTPIDMTQLVPGAVVPVDVGDCFRFHGDMMIESVDVKFSPGEETVTLDLVPVF